MRPVKQRCHAWVSSAGGDACRLCGATCQREDGKIVVFDARLPPAEPFFRKRAKREVAR